MICRRKKRCDDDMHKNGDLFNENDEDDGVL